MFLPTRLYFLCAFCVLLSGCGAVPSSNVASSGLTPIGTLNGTAFGGRQPIQGARIYLYAANTTAYGGASSSLLTSATGNPADGDGNFYVLTSATGTYLLTGDYTCTPGTQIYVVSLGGQPSPSVTNTAAGLMAVLGQCPSSGTLAGVVSFIDMNEVSTVAAAIALGPFAVDATHIGAPSATSPVAAIGLATAFASANLLYDVTGAQGHIARTSTPSGGTVPQTLLNALGNSIAACVNSSGPTSVPCTTSLFSAVRSTGTTGTTATDTATEAIYIAHNPLVAVSTIFGNATSSSAPYEPALALVPADFTVAITYKGGGLSSPTGIAMDTEGNAWVANAGNNTITQFTPAGVATNFSGPLTTPTSLTVDLAGDIWVANSGAASVTEFIAGIGTEYATVSSHPVAIAADGLGFIWTADSDNTVYKLNTSGVFQAKSAGTMANTLLSSPSALAVSNFKTAGTGDNVWVTNSVAATGVGATVVQNIPHAGNLSNTRDGIGTAYAVALDAGDRAWVANTNDTLSAIGQAGNVVAGSPYSGGGLSGARSMAIDGNGAVWLANQTSGSLSEFSNDGVALSPALFGMAPGSLKTPSGIAVDPAGNVWVTSTGSNAVVEFIGAATPVVTPLAAATASGATLGTKP